MNNNHRMTHVSDIVDIFNYFPNDKSCSSIYINIENIIKLIELTPVLYNNIPLLRTHMISKTKTYDSNSLKFVLLDKILEKNSTLQNNNLFLITDNDETIKYINNNTTSKLTILNQCETKNMINSDENDILIVDTNNNMLNDKINNNVHFLIFELL